MNAINAIEAEHTAEAKDEDEPMPQKLLIFNDMIIELAKPRNLNILMKTTESLLNFGVYRHLRSSRSTWFPGIPMMSSLIGGVRRDRACSKLLR